MVVRIRMLGPLDVTVDEVPVPVAGVRARSLLALLALDPGRPVSADTLVERCWDAATGDPRASLHTAVRRLRGLLGHDLIRRVEAGYLLDVPPDHVDAVTFRRLLDPTAAPDRERIEAALALWRGEPFDHDFSDWLTATERPRLVERWLVAVERRADLDLAAGRPGAAVGDLHDLVSAHPLRESLWVRLLTALHAGGRRAEALDRYGEMRARIVAELAVEPGPELRAVFERLLDDAPVGTPADRSGVAVHEPSTVTAPVSPSVPSSVPVSVPATPQQLPSDLPGFTGRTALLDRLDGVLAEAATPSTPTTPTTTVVLHGLGGAGKTSVAVHWAHRVGDRFPGGRLFVDLHGYGPGEPVRPGTALADLLRTLGVAKEEIPAGQDARSALLRSTLAGRRVLLVLDNARDEDQVRPLLPGAGALVVVTARSRLRGLTVRDGARQLAVEPFTAAEAVGFLVARVGGDRTTLAELAERCGGLPLALGIAAERVLDHPDRGPADVVAELVEEPARLDALGAEDPASDLRAVLSWSYDALDPATARFFRLLGVGPAPYVTGPSAAALCDVEVAAATRTLRRLVELNLLAESRPGRYRLHDLLRAYAAERCDAEDGPDLRWAAEERLLAWYCHTVRAAGVVLGRRFSLDDPGPPPPGIVPLPVDGIEAARAWFGAEWSSLSVLVEVAARRGHPALAARIAVQIGDEYAQRAAYDELRVVEEIARDTAAAAGLDRVHALAVNQVGVSAGIAGELDLAAERFETARNLFASLDDAEGQALTRFNLSHVHRLRGDADRAVAEAERAVVLARRAGSAPLLANALTYLAGAYLDTGRHADAELAAKEALTAWGDAPGWRPGETVATLGRVHEETGDLRSAADRYEEALGFHQGAGERHLAAEVGVRLGRALSALGETGRARRAWEGVLVELEGLSGPRLTVDRDQVLEMIAGLPGR